MGSICQCSKGLVTGLSMPISVSCSRTFYLSMCSSGYKSPDFVIVWVFVLYVELHIWLDQFGQLLHDTT